MQKTLVKWLSGGCLCGLLLLSVARAGEAAQPAVPKLLDLGSKEISVALIVNDLNDVLKNAETVAASVKPEEFKPGMLRAQVGMMLGDPELANLEAKPIVYVLFKAPQLNEPPQEPPPFAVFIPVKAAAPYDKVLTLRGLETAFEDGILFVAPTPKLLAKAKAQKAAYQKIVAAGLKKQVTLYADVSGLMSTYGKLIQASFAQIKAMMGQMPPPPAAGASFDPKNIQAILGLELKGFSALLEQTDAVQIDLSLHPDALLFDIHYAAQPGSALASLLTAPAPGTNKALDALTSAGVLTFAARCNPQGVRSFTKQLLEELEKDPEIAKFVDATFAADVTQWMECFTGDMAQSLKTFAEAQVALSVSDPAKALAALEATWKLLSPGSPLGDLYAGMGMKFAPTLEKAVRQHAGVSINRVNMHLEIPANAPNAAAMQKIPQKQELAFVNGLYLQASDPAVLDKMIDRVLAKTSTGAVALQSEKLFGAAKDFYIDCDVVELLKTAMEGNPMAQMMFGQLKGGVPTLLAGSVADGRFFSQGKFPLAPFIDFAKMSQSRQFGPPEPNEGIGPHSQRLRRDSTPPDGAGEKPQSPPPATAPKPAPAPDAQF